MGLAERTPVEPELVNFSGRKQQTQMEQELLSIREQALRRRRSISVRSDLAANAARRHLIDIGRRVEVSRDLQEVLDAPIHVIDDGREYPPCRPSHESTVVAKWLLDRGVNSSSESSYVRRISRAILMSFAPSVGEAPNHGFFRLAS